MSQGNRPVPLQVGVWITSKSTNLVLQNSSSNKYATEKYRVLTVEGQELNFRDDTDQGRFLIGRRIGYRTLKESEPRLTSIYTQIKPCHKNQRSLQSTRGVQNFLCCQTRYFSIIYRPTISSHFMKIFNLSRFGIPKKINLFS